MTNQRISWSSNDTFHCDAARLSAKRSIRREWVAKALMALFSVWCFETIVCAEDRSESRTANDKQTADIRTNETWATSSKTEPKSAANSLPIHCAVLPLERLEVSSQRDGRIKEIYGRPGTTIKADQIVVQMESDEQTIKRALAEGELRKATTLKSDRSALEAAQALLSKAEATYDMTLKLNQKSELELFRLKMDVMEKKANLKLAEARATQESIDFDIKEQQLELARWEEQRCALKSPVSGMVSEQFKFPGEFVRQGETILRIIHMERVAIRVEFDSQIVPTYKLANRTATATFSSGDGESFEIRGLQFDRILPSNLDSKHYHAIAVVDNPTRLDHSGSSHWLLRAGMVGKLLIHPATESEKTP